MSLKLDPNLFSTVIVELSFPSKCMLMTIHLANVLVVLFFKYLVFNLAYKRGIIRGQPINILILVDELEKLFFFILTAFAFTSTLSGTSEAYTTFVGDEENLCRKKTFALLHLSCFFYGSLSISVMRLVYIRQAFFLDARRWTHSSTMS